MTTFTATYSPEDNKLRLYASARLEPELYARVKAAGFIWAPKQGLFVAPTWTPGREDLLIELAGEIEDEDQSLVSRAEDRAERFESYSERRARDGELATAAADRIAERFEGGQPILVGHHSERRARKDQERMHGAMRRAVAAFKTSDYWRERAAGAVAAAKYRELPAVRARRIKKLESELRKALKGIEEAERLLKFWERPAITHEQAVTISNRYSFAMPRKEGDSDKLNLSPSAWDVLTNAHPTLYAPRTLQEVIDHARRIYPRFIARSRRWADHYENRLTYERAMLAADGGLESDRVKPEVGGGVRCWVHRGQWLRIEKVNRVTVTVHDSYNEGGRVFAFKVPFDKLTAVCSRANFEAMPEHEKRALPLTLREKPVAPTVDRAREAELRLTEMKSQPVVAVEGLWNTPVSIAARMVTLAGFAPGARVLEPSAGAGRIAQMVRTAGGVPVCVELRAVTASALRAQGFETVEGDFLTAQIEACDACVMNPPFDRGADIAHIERALTLVKPGGRVVALCAHGPRQIERLKPKATLWEDLGQPFADQGTQVRVALAVFEV